MPYRVALVDAGMIANAGHIPARKHLAPQVEIVGVYNHRLEHARNTSQRNTSTTWRPTMTFTLHWKLRSICK